MAVRAQDKWQFSPAENLGIQAGNILVVMTTPEGRKSLERSLEQAS